jgi:hypothetical protein
MIKFEFPNFFTFKFPRYRFGDGDPIPTLKNFPPIIREELYELIKEDDASRKNADAFNRFVFISLFASIVSFISVGFAIFIFFLFGFKSAFYPAVLLLALSAISNLMAYFYLKWTAEVFVLFFNNKRKKEDIFAHYEINERGVFKKETKSKPQ